MKKKLQTARVFLCMLLLAAVLLAGCGGEAAVTTAATAPSETSGQRLQIAGTKTEELHRIKYAVPDTERTVGVVGFETVSIALDGSMVPLQEAIEQKLVMPEEIAAWARLDAVEGYCEMQAGSEKGLTTFLYDYDGQFVVRVVNDILESPDGQQYHIEDVDIYPSVSSAGSNGVYYGDDGQPLASENWGLSFAVEDALPTGLTLVCTQSGGGQQLGALTLESYMLYSYATNDLLDNKEGAAGNSIQGENGAVIVECDATGRVALDWSESIGTLPAGKYMIIVSVLDVFDRESVHPLIVKYQYHQNHTVEFDIP